jgi:SET domain-containing protein
MPQALMRFAWLDGSWHALLFARADADIPVGAELTFDYELVTEDADDPALAVPCECGAPTCRGTLFQLREW